MTGAPPPPVRGIGGWRLLARAGGWLALVVVAHAALQAALVAVSPPLALSSAGVLLAVASALALLAATITLWLLASRAAARPTGAGAGASPTIAAAAAGAADAAASTLGESAAGTGTASRAGSGGGAPTIRRTVGWVVVTGVVCAVVGVVAPYLLPVVAAVGCPLIATGSPRGVARLASAHPGRFVVLLVVTALAVVGAFLVSLLLGLFVTGWPAAAGTWPAAGVAAAVLVCQWVALARRAT
ncbi:hypothetical protein SCB71_17485 [Herbiconiux sp. KACC 21604]|uniref:hypothetical protein n=1 Tax=unclassified Herbiconiux TaxID=2618217 RepID=UPI0014927A74|nr:hypothetical protein [Herbiconiux sp. SALV-R1]QJU54869.1 hypothetical protein HL652_15440 [Herbiconiux sp. SALV-R1]WPO85991.1 hypothetical protein SCB71_17485 [Herbiconiux sp. KACC 21604]